MLLREAAKKNYFLSGRATKRGGGLNGCATKGKRTFFLMQGKKFLWPPSRGGEAKGLSGRATKKLTNNTRSGFNSDLTTQFSSSAVLGFTIGLRKVL